MMSGHPSNEDSTEMSRTRDTDIDLRSSGAPSSLTAEGGSYTESGSRVMMETGTPGSGQQVITSPTQPTLFQPRQTEGGSVKEGLELTVPNSPPPHIIPPGSQFVTSSISESLPDDVLVEKQRNKEQYYQSGSAGGSKSSRDSYHAEYKSYPVEETHQTQGNIDHGAKNPDQSSDSFVEYPSMTSSSSLNPQVSSTPGDLSLQGVTSSFTNPSQGAQPTSTPHSTGSPWQQNPRLTIGPEDYPEEFKEGQFDCVLIYCETDVKMALNFKDILQKFIILENGQPPKVCVLDRNDNLSWIASRFKHADEAMDRSTYMFLFVTETFVTDAWAEIQKDECLMESIRDPKKKWCVVPLHATFKRDVKFRYPYGLRALKGVDISIMLKGKTLTQVEPKNLTVEDLDSHFLENITRMFNHKLGRKLERERSQELKLKQWILDERERRARQLILEQHQMERRRIENETRRAKLIEQTEKDLENVRVNVETVKLGDLDKSGKTPEVPNLSHMLQSTMAMMSGMTPEQQLIQMQVLQMQMNLMQQAQGLQGQIPVAFPGMPGLPQMAPHTTPPTAPVYNIHNYAQMQVGDGNRQTVNQGMPSQAPDEEEEFIVVEEDEDAAHPGSSYPSNEKPHRSPDPSNDKSHDNSKHSMESEHEHESVTDRNKGSDTDSDTDSDKDIPTGGCESLVTVQEGRDVGFHRNLSFPAYKQECSDKGETRRYHWKFGNNPVPVLDLDTEYREAQGGLKSHSTDQGHRLNIQHLSCFSVDSGCGTSFQSALSDEDDIRNGDGRVDDKETPIEKSLHEDDEVGKNSDRTIITPSKAVMIPQLHVICADDPELQSDDQAGSETEEIDADYDLDLHSDDHAGSDTDEMDDETWENIQSLRIELLDLSNRFPWLKGSAISEKGLEAIVDASVCNISDVKELFVSELSPALSEYLVGVTEGPSIRLCSGGVFGAGSHIHKLDGEGNHVERATVSVMGNTSSQQLSTSYAVTVGHMLETGNSCELKETQTEKAKGTCIAARSPSATKQAHIIHNVNSLLSDIALVKMNEDVQFSNRRQHGTYQPTKFDVEKNVYNGKQVRVGKKVHIYDRDGGTTTVGAKIKKMFYADELLNIIILEGVSQGSPLDIQPGDSGSTVVYQGKKKGLQVGFAYVIGNDCVHTDHAVAVPLWQSLCLLAEVSIIDISFDDHRPAQLVCQNVLPDFAALGLSEDSDGDTPNAQNSMATLGGEGAVGFNRDLLNSQGSTHVIDKLPDFGALSEDSDQDTPNIQKTPDTLGGEGAVGFNGDLLNSQGSNGDSGHDLLNSGDTTITENMVLVHGEDKIEKALFSQLKNNVLPKTRLYEVSDPT